MTQAATPAAKPIPAGDNPELVLPLVEEYLGRARALQRWYREFDAAENQSARFPLIETFNRPESSYGFFADLPSEGGSIPIIGSVHEMFYDRTRVPAADVSADYLWLRAQLREFVLRYFMRISAFRLAEAVVGEGGKTAPPALLQGLNWCSAAPSDEEGFGYTQWFAKRAGSGEIVRFLPGQRNAICDLRDVGPVYEWLVLKVNIFDFAFRFNLPGLDGPGLVLPLKEDSYLVVSREFIRDETSDEGGTYGFGYAFVHSTGQSLLAYGPGQFEAAWQQIDFHIEPSGQISARLTFVANEPKSVVNIDLNPIQWGLRLGKWGSFGIADSLFDKAAQSLQSVRLPFDSFDPVVAFIKIANLATGGQAARSLCISTRHLAKVFLFQHYLQHYQAVAGSLLTWRQIPDWTNEAGLPAWVRSGTPQ